MDDNMIMMLLYGAIFIVVYFFFIRPQSQKAKKEKEMIELLEKGHKVVMTSGIHGVIDRVEDKCFIIEIDKNVKVKVEKAGVSYELTASAYGPTTEKK